MRSRILLTGKNGQIGHDLQELLAPLGEIIGLDRTQLDLANLVAVRQAVRELRPRLIVNAAAYTAVDKAESEPTLAQVVNGDAPGIMAEEARRVGAGIVHYSTDYVFDGIKGEPYAETDETNPINVYGRTKLAGEWRIQEAGVPYLIFRTSWVYSTRGRNFLLTILRLASERKELRVVNDQIGAPTWSRMAAAGTVKILSLILSPNWELSRLEKLGGVYHLTAAGDTTWYDFARAILEGCSDSARLGSWFEAATPRGLLASRRLLPIATSEYPTPARRPPYSVLSNAKVRGAFDVQLPHWRTQLQLALGNQEAQDIQPALTPNSP